MNVNRGGGEKKEEAVQGMPLKGSLCIEGEGEGVEGRRNTWKKREKEGKECFSKEQLLMQFAQMHIVFTKNFCVSIFQQKKIAQPIATLYHC